MKLVHIRIEAPMTLISTSNLTIKWVLYLSYSNLRLEFRNIYEFRKLSYNVSATFYDNWLAIMANII